MTRPPAQPGTREKLLRVAERRFAQRGFAGTNLKGIADEVGVQKTALYHYFPSKAALFTAVIERMLDAFDRTIAAATGPGRPPARALAELLDELNHLFGDNPHFAPLLIRIFVDRVEIDDARILPVLQRVVGDSLRFYRDGVRSGAFRDLSAQHVFQSVLGMAVFHYAACSFSQAVVGVEDLFHPDAVARRGDEMRRLVLEGVIREEG